MDTAFIITPFIRVKCGLFEEIPNFCSTLFSLILPTPALLFEFLSYVLPESSLLSKSLLDRIHIVMEMILYCMSWGDAY